MGACVQAAARGKAAAPTQPDADDPLKAQYGDPPLIQSREETGDKFWQVGELSPELKGHMVSTALPRLLL